MRVSCTVRTTTPSWVASTLHALWMCRAVALQREILRWISSIELREGMAAVDEAARLVAPDQAPARGTAVRALLAEMVGAIAAFPTADTCQAKARRNLGPPQETTA